MILNRLIILGFLLVLIGAVLPFLIVIQVLESTLLLNLIAFVSSTAGIFLGVIGTATYVGQKRQHRKWQDTWK